jgi:hypothetical protein
MLKSINKTFTSRKDSRGNPLWLPGISFFQAKVQYKKGKKMDKIKCYFENDDDMFSFESVSFIEKQPDGITIYIDVLHHINLSYAAAITFMIEYRAWLENKNK